ncbi:MAG: SMP-30/gluconolactonase/LRE family protein, partial [Verrucomicrobia bacterium]|nr:SMP-30/gluconolactonase/LRE family protein [Verrucomicrobiota bacterium]
GRTPIPLISGQCLFFPRALTFSPDQTQIYVSSQGFPTVQSFKVGKDELLNCGQDFFHLEPLHDRGIQTGGLSVDTSGWLYVATALGIQVCDLAGRVNFIIPTPEQPHDVCFGGKDLGELFIACGHKIYKRPTKTHGIVSGQMAPIKPVPRKL